MMNIVKPDLLVASRHAGNIGVRSGRRK